MSDNIEVAIINQLSDNYSYIVYSTKIKKALIVDPAESKPLIDYLIEKDLSLQGILITHHHSDHTSGIKGLLNFKSVNVYSPSLKISKTSVILKIFPDLFSRITRYPSMVTVITKFPLKVGLKTELIFCFQFITPLSVLREKNSLLLFENKIELPSVI